MPVCCKKNEGQESTSEKRSEGVIVASIGRGDEDQVNRKEPQAGAFEITSWSDAGISGGWIPEIWSPISRSHA